MTRRPTTKTYEDSRRRDPWRLKRKFWGGRAYQLSLWANPVIRLVIPTPSNSPPFVNSESNFTFPSKTARICKEMRRDAKRWTSARISPSSLFGKVWGVDISTLGAWQLRSKGCDWRGSQEQIRTETTPNNSLPENIWNTNSTPTRGEESCKAWCHARSHMSHMCHKISRRAVPPYWPHTWHSWSEAGALLKELRNLDSSALNIEQLVKGNAARRPSHYSVCGQLRGLVWLVFWIHLDSRFSFHLLPSPSISFLLISNAAQPMHPIDVQMLVGACHSGISTVRSNLRASRGEWKDMEGYGRCVVCSIVRRWQKLMKMGAKMGAEMCRAHLLFGPQPFQWSCLHRRTYAYKTFNRTVSRLKRTYPQSLQQQAENHPLNPSSGDGPLSLFKTR